MTENKPIKPAICCLGYNRPNSLKRLLNSIGMAEYPFEDVTLIISIDECNESDNVESVARDFQWSHGNKIIKRYEKRLGVRNHTLAIGDLSYEYGAVIYLEDDIVVAPSFYLYTCEALKTYGECKYVFGIALYSQQWIGSAQTTFTPAYVGGDAYLFSGDVSWGQCWISQRWKEFHDWYDNTNNILPDYDPNVPKAIYGWDTSTSWSKFISFYMSEKGLHYVVPYVSQTTCFSDKGQHTGFNSDQCQVPISQSTVSSFNFLEESKCAMYDAFFERKDAFINQICGISFNNICVDLNGMKYDYSNYEAVLTTKHLDYECLCSFGINMEPIELNVKYSIEGNCIRLYRVPQLRQKDNLFNSIQVPTSNMVRIYHQIGKYRKKNVILMALEKLRPQK